MMRFKEAVERRSMRWSTARKEGPGSVAAVSRVFDGVVVSMTEAMPTFFYI
jgi:hypothetical protein